MKKITVALLFTLACLPPARADAGPAKLLDAKWNADAGIPPESEITDEGHVLTTSFPAGPAELVAHATLTYDVSRGDDGILQFLSSHSWVKCEAPDGLVVPESGLVAVVCRPTPKNLARIKKKTRVYIKADPPGGGRHKKLYWVLVPVAAPTTD